MKKIIIGSGILIGMAIALAVSVIFGDPLVIENNSGDLIQEFRLKIGDLILREENISANSSVRRWAKPDYTESVSYSVQMADGRIYTARSGTINIPHKGIAIVTVEADGQIVTSLK